MTAGAAPSASSSTSRHERPPLSRSRSFPAAGGRPPQAGPCASADVGLDQMGDGCSADAVRQAADSVTADDPDFKETVPYLTTVSDGLKQECLKQLIALKQKLLREFAEVLCLVERKYTLKYAESLSEAREQQTVARYYQMAFEKHRKIVEKMAVSLDKSRLRHQLSRCFNAWRRLAHEARAAKKEPGVETAEGERDGQAGGDSDCIDIEYTRTEEIGSKLYERKLTAQLTKALERDARAQECRKYHTGPPCSGKVGRCRPQVERQRYRRIEQLECELELAKRREQQLVEQKHRTEAKYRQAVLRSMPVAKDGEFSDPPPPSECAATKTTTICRRPVDSSDSTLPPARIRRSQSEKRRGSPRARSCGGGGRRRARSRAPPAGRGTQTRHLSCVAPLPPQGGQRNAECVTSKTQRRPRVKVCAERQGPRRAVLTEARSRAAAAAADVLEGMSDSSITVNCNEARRKTEITEKWRQLLRN